MSRRVAWVLLGFIALSTPLALAVETGLRKIMFPPEFEEVRDFLRPTLTGPVWFLLPIVALCTLAAARWMGRRIEKRMAARPAEEQTEAFRTKEAFDAMMLFTSLPQVPAIFGTFMFMFGAALTPVVVVMAAATLGVLVVGLVGMRQSAVGPQSRDA